MKYNNFMNISIQQIYLFLKAAEYENFSKVAVESNMTQSTISRNIESLEIIIALNALTMQYGKYTA